MPGTDTILLAVMAMLAYAGSFAFALTARKAVRLRLASPILMLLAGGLILNLTVIAVRLAEGHLPLSTSLDVFAVLAMACGLMALYLKAMDRRRYPELVLTPLADVCLLAGLLLAAVVQKDFARSILNVVHVAMAVGGVACFATAAGAGAIYLRTHRALRRKDPAALQSHWPSLERLDRFIRQMLPIGFALLTVSMALGLWEAFSQYGGRFFRSWQTHPKLLIATAAWLLYALTLHVVHARPYRGRQAAVLSLVGVALLVAVLVVSMVMREIPA